MKEAASKFRINPSAHRFELEVEGAIAFIDYKMSGRSYILVHTEVPTELEGQGVGSALVAATLQYAKDNGYTIIPRCSFVKAYLQKHGEWREIVAAGE